MSPEALYLITFGLVVLEKIVCFILGYLTIRLGYLLIASGVKGEFKFAAKLGGVKTDLASVSPGLLFVLLGVMLIGFAIYVDKGAKLGHSTYPQDNADNTPSILVPNKKDPWSTSERSQTNENK